MHTNTSRLLGHTEGAPARTFEEAFDNGCNYFYYGSLRKDNMCRAIKNISGYPESMVQLGLCG